ncbi:MAG: bacitracin ABC transporter ATP-binding protein, partial [Leptolyngbya sp. ERB_1_2]
MTRFNILNDSAENVAPAVSNLPFLEINHLFKAYKTGDRETIILKDINLTIGEREF